MSTPTTAPALSLEQIDMHYGFVQALSKVDFAVHPGEVVALLGDNGAGKSTLLKVMSGAHRATAGSIRVHGEEVQLHAPKDAEAADELATLGVTTAPVSRPVEMLSGGQRQVVALARSAVRVSGDQNGILLLDEPTAALGYEQTRQVEELVLRLAKRGIAIVIVTHNLPLCYEVADRIVVLNRGRKVADVRTAETDNDSVVGWITGSKAPQEHLAA